MKRSLAFLFAAAMAFLAITAWALESGGVGVLETRRADGSTRSTHVWYADEGGLLWLEAATPERGWLQDAIATPTVTFTTDGVRRELVAAPVSEPGGHEKVRRMLREKYGWRDAWVGLLQDTSGSLAVNLRPAAPGTRGAPSPRS